jgi:DNA modification methylase
MYQLIQGDCLDILPQLDCVDTIFADPPDNIGLGYKAYKDKLVDAEYVRLLSAWLTTFVTHARTVWFSYNAKWTFQVGRIVAELLATFGPKLEAKACVQVFTFGQHNQHDLGNNHRPLIRLRWPQAPLFPDAIRVPSWRQQHGDPRADARGRVPGDVFETQPDVTSNIGSWLSAALDDPATCDAMKDDIRQWFETCSGDVFDYPRVTGNSKQRRSYHPTQLNEGLVERCLKLTTPRNGRVIDPFGGTGTTLRVCKAINLACTLIELDPFYCEKIVEEHRLTSVTNNSWVKE